MGSNKSKPGIYIETEKQFYVSGQVVKGCIYINAPEPYPVLKIMLSIVGKEKSWWRYRQNNNNNNKGGQINNNSRAGFKPNNPTNIPLSGDRMGQVKVIQTSFVLNNWNSNSKCLHGQFAFPFQFQLPSFIPGTFRQQTSQFKASVIYQIQCRCVSPKKSADDIVSTIQLVIREPKKKNEQSLYGQTYIYPQSCFCRKNGVAKICCYFQKNQYIPGQQCIAICQADNYKCRLKISQINVRFKKIVTLTSGFGEQKTFEQQINRASFPGVAANEQYTGAQAKKITIPLKYRDNKAFQSTTNGRLVKCQYYLQVTPDVSGWFVKNIKSFQVNLNIVHEGLAINKIEQPQNWNPQVLRKSQIVLNQNFSNDFIDEMGNKNYF